MGAQILTFLAPYLGRVAAGAAIVAALGLGWWGFATHYESKGYDRAMADVETHNKETADAVRKGVAAVGACRAAGGVWDQTVRHCDRGL